VIGRGLLRDLSSLSEGKTYLPKPTLYSTKECLVNEHNDSNMEGELGFGDGVGKKVGKGGG
jgi:hypothetical protein